MTDIIRLYDKILKILKVFRYRPYYRLEDEKCPILTKTVCSFAPQAEQGHSFLEKESLTASKIVFRFMNLQRFGYPDQKNGVKKAKYSDHSE